MPLTYECSGFAGWVSVCRYLRSFGGSAGDSHGQNRCRCAFRCRSNYLVVVYITVKLLYLINIAAQLFLLDMFLGTPFHAYGFEVCSCCQGLVTRTGSGKLVIEDTRGRELSSWITLACRGSVQILMQGIWGNYGICTETMRKSGSPHFW